MILRFFPLLFLFFACGGKDPSDATVAPTTNPSKMPTVTSQAWGNIPEGEVELFTLTNEAGNSVQVMNWGGIIQSIKIDEVEMVIGFDSLAGYQGSHPYFGALIGRYGNRIANASFELEDTTYQLTANENGNQLHGGPRGFDDYLWAADTTTTDSSAILRLSHVSPDGDMGFPGKLEVSCAYEWTNDNALRLHYEATTDKNTIVNLTNHTYFNIGGGGTILDQTLRLNADRYTPVSESLIPLGGHEEVAGTPFDFLTAQPIGQDIRADHPQIRLANGYDHNWVLNGYDGSLREFALLTDPASGRKLRCFTTEPGVQIFTANFPEGRFIVRGGTPMPKYGAICLETQHFPNSPNQENFQTPLLKVGEQYNTTTVYRFE